MEYYRDRKWIHAVSRTHSEDRLVHIGVVGRTKWHVFSMLTVLEFRAFAYIAFELNALNPREAFAWFHKRSQSDLSHILTSGVAIKRDVSFVGVNQQLIALCQGSVTQSQRPATTADNLELHLGSYGLNIDDTLWITITTLSQGFYNALMVTWSVLAAWCSNSSLPPVAARTTTARSDPYSYRRPQHEWATPEWARSTAAFHLWWESHVTRPHSILE